MEGYKKRGKIMNIQSINNTMSKDLKYNKISFKEADVAEVYIRTPYDQEMDSLCKQTQSQIKMIKFLYKNNSTKMKQTVDEISQLAFKKAEMVKAKYLAF